jgi:CDP-glucose 4,6-dehydratase
MRAIISGRPVRIRSPHSIRPWQHVLEPLSGYLLLAQRLYEEGPAFAEAWNFGPNDDDAKPVDWILDKLTQTWGEGASWKLDKGEHPHEAHYLKLDCSKAKSQLHWQPKWSLATAIEEICVWHKAHTAGADMKAMCLHQIKQYEMA